MLKSFLGGHRETLRDLAASYNGPREESTWCELVLVLVWWSVAKWKGHNKEKCKVKTKPRRPLQSCFPLTLMHLHSYRHVCSMVSFISTGRVVVTILTKLFAYPLSIVLPCCAFLLRTTQNVRQDYAKPQPCLKTWFVPSQ